MSRYYLIAGLFCSLITSACGPSLEERARALRERSSVAVNIPRSMTNAEDAPDIKDDSGKVVSVTRGEYYVGSEQYPIDSLSDRIRKDRGATPNAPVYFQAESSEEYGDVATTLDAVRKAGGRSVALLVRADDRGPLRRLLVTIPPEPTANDRAEFDSLRVEFTKDGKLTVNGKDAGSPEQTDKVVEAIKAAAGRPVTIKGRRETRYVDVVRIVNTAKGAGAASVNLVIDDLS